MPRAVCNPITFQISGNRSPSYLNGKYRVGKVLEDTLFLEPYEAMFLYFTGRIIPENVHFRETGTILDAFITDRDDFDTFRTYFYLKSKGMYVRRDNRVLMFGRKNDRKAGNVLRVMGENSTVTFEELTDTAPALYSTIDDEGDITLFSTVRSDPLGEVTISWPAAGSMSQSGGIFFVDQAPGLEWLGSRFSDKIVLTDMEARHILAGEQVRADGTGEIANTVYEDLVRRKLIVRTGFKYGANFRAYRKSMSDHAEYLVHVMDEADQWYRISRAVRLSHGVRKSMLFAGLYQGKVEYISISRILDFFSKM
ncbi:MAG: tRNA-intron lyase [Thermoplasmatales archaeon B_DKE]|nr:MAG: tRNA-intron lyase [Thermoplasmatales archaeon B_DKE]